MKRSSLHRVAFFLALFTIAANIVEGVASMALRVQDETPALFGFGVGSFVEVILAAGLVLGGVVNVAAGRMPESTIWGVVVSLISIVVMTGLVAAKRRVGRALHSAPIPADAQCTLVCIYMSVVLLASSALFELTGFGLLDSLGALGLARFSHREGREPFNKAGGRECACGPA
jgi:divalent metal cation (Fe/Co/Zn/Cd) transporter